MMLIHGGERAAQMVSAVSSGSAIGVDELSRVMEDSSVSGEEKTGFLIRYLLSQREPLLRFGQTLLFALLVFFIGRRVVKLLLSLTRRWMERHKIEASVCNFVMSLAHVLYNLLLIFIVAGILGLGTSSIIAMVGSAGLAIGLALQGSLSNLAGGVLILMLKPFQVGDYIVTDGVEGTVQSIDIFYTRLTTTDNKVVVIPNGTISNSNVTNTSKQEQRMQILEFSVGYDADLEAVKSLLLEQLRKDSMVIQDRPMDVVVDKLNPIRIRMQMKFWTRAEHYWEVRYRMLPVIKDTLQKQGISIG